MEKKTASMLMGISIGLYAEIFDNSFAVNLRVLNEIILYDLTFERQ